MPTWLQITVVVVAVPWAGWTTVQIMKLWAAIADIRARQGARETECKGRLEWLRGMDTKLDTVAESQARIEGLLSRPPKHWSEESP